MALQIGAGIGDERKAGGVRLGKSIQSEGLYGLDNLLLGVGVNAILRHPLPQLYLEFPHSRLRTPHPHCPA